jgi:hypothetical protein
MRLPRGSRGGVGMHLPCSQRDNSIISMVPQTEMQEMHFVLCAYGGKVESNLFPRIGRLFSARAIFLGTKNKLRHEST